MIDYNDFDEFCKNFDIVENAMEMRYLQRWNGRRVGKENLAEHTHLVVACVIKLINELKTYIKDFVFLSPYEIVKAAMLHDSLEILRGDILNITKQKFPQIDEVITNEEVKFRKKVGSCLNDTESAILSLADSMACLKFIENEMNFNTNSDLIHEIYTQVYKVYMSKYHKFLATYCQDYDELLPDYDDFPNTFAKGYEQDAGADVLLKNDVTFLPMSTKKVDLEVKVTPEEGKMAFLCARTSAAERGLCVAMCPIDPNYTGTVTAIVHNVSNDIVRYTRGQAFCQVVSVPITETINRDEIFVKKQGKRTNSKLGGTGI